MTLQQWMPGLSACRGMTARSGGGRQKEPSDVLRHVDSEQANFRVAPSHNYWEVLTRSGFFNNHVPGSGSNYLISANLAFAGNVPKIHGRIGPPRPPSLGSALKLTNTPQLQGAQKTKITGRERIRFAERSHGHVLRCPLSNAGDFT